MSQTNYRYLEALATHVLVFDGAMGTNLQMQHLTAADFGGDSLVGCNDILVISKPAAVASVHESFLDVGCDVIETCTFRANRLTMREYGLEKRILEMNTAAAQLARRIADRHSTSDKPRYVAGSIGPSGMLPSSSDPTLSAITFGELVDVFCEQASGLLTGGCDLISIETSQDMLEVKAVVIGVRRACRETGIHVPIQVQVTLDTTGRMLLGTDIAAVLATLEPMGIDVIGLNCSTGPEHMHGAIAYLSEQSLLPISCLPNAGLPLNVDGQAVYPLEPGRFAAELEEFVTRYGVAAVGGCCGTTPIHLHHLVKAVGGRRRQPQGDQVRTPMVSSAMRATALTQTPPPMLIGERLNTQGSKKMKELLVAGDYDSILDIARDQVEGGAHTLDICVALTERADEAAQMRAVVRQLSQRIEAPLVIDTTEADVLRAALEAAPGRSIVNAIHLENGRQRMDAMLPLIRDHGAAVIALTIDEQGMARQVDHKVAVARRIYEIAVGEYGLRPDALIVDALTFTVATGDRDSANAAVETLSAIARIKQELPGVLTSLGVSNVSYGFKPAARAVLNSVFLYHAVEAGLDMAIVNPKQITPYAEIPAEQRALADDLVFNRSPEAFPRFVSHFEGIALKTEASTDALADLSPEARAHWRVLHRRKDGIEPDVDAIVERLVREKTGIASFHTNDAYRYPNAETSAAAIWTLNEVLLPAMKEVGDKFGCGELILPFVLQSAEVMKQAVTRLERYLERTEGMTKGTIVLATVYGDVHDIGKNLVKTILANNGYTVVDLGKQVPAAVIVDKVAETKADAVGLSALLVSTSKQMPLVLQELRQRGLRVPVLIGGAAINRAFKNRIALLGGTEPYRAGVFYCRDAFDGLSTMDRLCDPERREAAIREAMDEASQHQARTQEA